MRFIRFIIQLALHPLATRRRRAMMILLFAAAGFAFPGDRLIAACAMVVTIVAIIQLRNAATARQALAVDKNLLHLSVERPRAAVTDEVSSNEDHPAIQGTGEDSKQL
ncbi:hypothetical protein [Nonomuraea typhae]|uniref:Uncharacterized protein n=1 Tax=Nonomuraea typhae TaxID=2603600 RepID=A0ABW7Z1T8_9ACTN